MTLPFARALAAVSLSAAALAAQRPDPLGDLVREGLRNNQALAQERLADLRAAAGVRQARGTYLPTLALNARYSEVDGVVNLGDVINPAYAALNQLVGQDRFPTDVNTTLPFKQETKLTLAAPLFNEAVNANLQIARGLAGLQGAQRRAAERALARDIQLAYLGHASAVRAVEVLTSALAVVRENERVTDRLRAAGTLTPDAVLRATAERTNVEQQRADAERQVAATRRGLNFLLGRADLEAPVALVADSLLPGAATFDPAAYVEPALGRREELAQAAAGVRVARGQERLARAPLLPTVSAAVDYGIQGQEYRYGSEQDFVIASVVLSWNILNGGQDGARRAQARYESDRARVREQEARRAVELQVRDAVEAARVAQAIVATADARFAAADRNLALVQRRFENGLATPLEFLDARSAQTAAGLDRVIARYTAAARWVELERAAALRPLDP